MKTTTNKIGFIATKAMLCIAAIITLSFTANFSNGIGNGAFVPAP